MSEFKSSHLALLNAQDAHIVIDGYEIDTIAEEGPSECGATVATKPSVIWMNRK